jgi:hypothetical protein
MCQWCERLTLRKYKNNWNASSAGCGDENQKVTFSSCGKYLCMRAHIFPTAGNHYFSFFISTTSTDGISIVSVFS